MKSVFSIDVDSKRVFGLDLLRAFAIFTVCRGHAGAMLYDTVFDPLTNIPFPHGVDIFFVMSGFLIGKSYLSYLERNNNTLGRTKILTFYARTALRILPNYLFLLLVNWLLVHFQVITGDTKTFPIWRFATFTQNIFKPFWGFYWESWSLPVQWWFYIFFPLLLVVLSRFSKPKKYIPWLCLFFVAGSIIYRLIEGHQVTDSFSWDIWLRKTLASRTENIYIGVLAAWVMHYYREQWNRHATVCFVVGIVFFVVLQIIPHVVGSFYYDVLYLTFSAVAIAMWVPLLSKWKSSKTDVGTFVSWISILSYSMFLTNLCLVCVMRENFPAITHENGIWGYLLFWPVVLVVSYLLHIFVEKPFMRIRDRVL